MNCPRRHMCWQSKRFYWEGHPGGEQESKGTQESCSAAWLAVLGFMVMGLFSGLSLANISDSESFLVVHTLFCQVDIREKDSGRWSDMWCHLLTFPELLLVAEAYSSVFLTGTSCRKTTYANGYYAAWPGWTVSISVLPLTIANIFSYPETISSFSWMCLLTIKLSFQFFPLMLSWVLFKNPLPIPKLWRYMFLCFLK